MKKIALSMVLCIAILVGFIPQNTFAQTKRDITFEEQLAMELKSLGLFKGVSDTNFDLNREPSRVEALVMLIRVLGKESEVLNGEYVHPFIDVPDWANKYVGYAYENGLTKGISDTEFGSENATSEMYITFVLRALGYSDVNESDFSWDNPYTLAKNINILPDLVDIENFLRADVVVVSHYALSAILKGSEQTLAEKLISAGVFSHSQYLAILEKSSSTSNISALSLNHEYIYLSEGECVNLQAITTPTIKNPRITWLSSEPSYVSVDQNGMASVVSKGGDRIKITATAENGLVASCWIIMKSSVPVAKQQNGNMYYIKYPQILSLDNLKDNVNLWTEHAVDYPEFGIYSYNYVYQTKTLEQAEAWARDYAYFLKSKGYTLIREEDNPMIIQGMGSDIIYALIDPTGQYLISVTSDCSGYNGYISANVDVSIKSADDIFAVRSISLDKQKLNLSQGEKQSLTAIITPQNVEYKNVRWKSSDSNVVLVESNSNYNDILQQSTVTAVGEGNAIITATSSNGLVASCEITVGGNKVVSNPNTNLPNSSNGSVSPLSAEDIYKRCAPAIFYMEVFDSRGVMLGTGSGFFISDNGVAITCEHVINGSSAAKIYLPDGRTYWVDSIVSANESKDIAILKINADNLPYLPVGNSDIISGGQNIFAIGSPLGLSNTISDGIVSNPKRVVNGTHYIQISSPISSGSSGGALLNEYGQVIGITAASFVDGQNLNLAVPINLIYTLR